MAAPTVFEKLGEKVATDTTRHAVKGAIKATEIDHKDIPRAGHAYSYGDEKSQKQQVRVMQRPTRERDESAGHYIGELRDYNANLAQRIRAAETAAERKALQNEKNLTDGEIRKVSEQARLEQKQQREKERPGPVEQIGGRIQREAGHEVQREINKAIHGFFR